MMIKTDFGPIYEQVLAHCPSYVHPAPWQKVPVPDNIRQPPPDPAVVLDALRAQYPESQLLDSGAVVREGDGDLQLASALYATDGPLIALRKKGKDLPFDLLTPAGSLAGKRLPACATFSDERFRQLYQQSGSVLCVACTTADAALLLSLGVPATLASGLEGLHGKNLEDVCEQYELARVLPDGSRDRRPIRGLRLPQAVFLDGSLVRLSAEEPPGLAAIIAHCSDVERQMSICLERFFLWRPTMQEIERIRFCQRHGRVGDIGAAIVACLTACRQKLVSWAPTEEPPQDLHAAIQHLEAGAGRSDGRAPSRNAWSAAQQLIDRQCLAPWLEQLEQTEDPAERNLLFAAAMASGIGHVQSLRLFLTMRRGPASNAKPSPSLVPAEDFQQYMHSTNLLLRTMEALRKYRENP